MGGVRASLNFLSGRNGEYMGRVCLSFEVGGVMDVWLELI